MSRLEDNEIIFSTITGSVAYGTNMEGSDEDVRGVAIRNDKSYYFGFLKRFEQQEDDTKDEVIYDIRKFFNLAAGCNPNIIELLFTDERFHKKTSKYWERIMEHREKFLSKNAKNTFIGYSFAQLKRIKTARGYLLNPPKKKPERSDFGLPDNTTLLSKDELGAFQWIMAFLLKDSAQYLAFSETTRTELEQANWIGLIQRKGVPEEKYESIQKLTGMSDNFMEVMKREQSYIHAKREWDSYTNWKASRNKKRAELEEKYKMDTKHASHLVRLCREGREILETGKVQVYRPDREELLAIRNGAWSYEQVEEYANNMESEMAKIAETSTLPKEPDRNFLDQLCIKTIEEFLDDHRC
jgi:predicted nucleotidyltransferase